jgi:hypothetical protein
MDSADQETAEFSINQIKLSCRQTTNKLLNVKKSVYKQRNRINVEK